MNLRGLVGNTAQSIATFDQEYIKQSQWGSAQGRNSGRYCRTCLKVILQNSEGVGYSSTDSHQPWIEDYFQEVLTPGPSGLPV